MSAKLLLMLLLAAGALGAGGEAFSQSPGDEKPAPPEEYGPVADIKLYFTAPLRWDRGDWALFGGALLAIGAAHHYDADVRTHFVKTEGALPPTSSKDLEDALPTVAVVAATWGYAHLISDSAGQREGWAMVEAGALSSVTAYALKYATLRVRPDQTTDPNQWGRSGGDAFPSLHATAAFAVGTVLAESGNDDYRWVRRFLGYGLGAVTSYERLKHKAHWLSDTVAGAALGAASAQFVMGRVRREEEGQLGIVPVERGAMLSYTVSLP